MLLPNPHTLPPQLKPPLPSQRTALDYINRGFAVTPIPHKEKGPRIPGWENRKISGSQVPAYFNGQPTNFGAILGVASGNLTDVDGDCAEVLPLLDGLPDTDFIFGRKSKPRSHRFYRADQLPKTTQFKDPTDGAMLMELRADGAQTVLPGSTHPSGEPIEFEPGKDGEPAKTDGLELLRQVARIAAMALLVRHYPGEGSRHDFALALAGALLRAGWELDEVLDLVRAVVEGAGDEEADDRLRAVADTAGKVNAGQTVTGWPTFANIVDSRVIAKVRAWLGIVDDCLLDKNDPLPAARQFISDNFSHPDRPTLVYHDQTIFEWIGGAYTEKPPDALRAELYPWLERHRRTVRLKDGTEKQVPFQPTPRDVSAVTDALQSLAFVPMGAPAWLVDDASRPDPRHLIVAPNGIFKMSDGGLLRPLTPLLFIISVLDYNFDPGAPGPADWLRFLDVLFPGDPQSIGLLQEWFGYVLSGETLQQKMLLLVGPPRSGKGTIARVLRAMIGHDNACGPTLGSLGTNFGLWAWIGKKLAVISDARLGGRADHAVIAERLLSITGEDAITIDRKNLPPVTLTLPTRIMVLTNELPRLSDASGALAQRFLILVLKESFLGREDTELTARLLLELPGILNWSLQGWRRLLARGRFITPDAAKDATEQLNDLASPVAAFVRDCCRLAAVLSIRADELFDAWRMWCGEQGATPGTLEVFGKNLGAAFPAAVKRTRPRQGEKRGTVYQGIALTPDVSKAARQWQEKYAWRQPPT